MSQIKILKNLETEIYWYILYAVCTNLDHCVQQHCHTIFFLDANSANENLNREMLSVLANPQRLEDMYKDLLLDGSNTFSLISCTVGTDTCPPNEECVQNYPKSRAGTCKCKVNEIILL